MTQAIARQNPIVLVIDFHHARGPEIELCFADEGTNPAVENDWSLLPFMALSDGAHASTEDFSYFTLRREATSTQNATSLFGISCTRQIPASSLINRSPEVTRSTVQKAVVVVSDGPQHFGRLREKLSMVTSAWFAQRDFSDVDILKKFRESLIASLKNEDAHKDTYLDCADPAFDSYAENTEKATSLKTSERSSLLAYMGLPLQLFGKASGSIFGPYTPLQQLDLLADHGTKSYIVGSTNSLLLQQKDRYSDILINLDEGAISIQSPAMRTALALTAADRRWIDFLTQTINETWDPSHPEQPKTHGYVGSEEFIRLQFEEYLLALLSCTNHRQHVQPSSPVKANETKNKVQSADAEADPTLEFNQDFVAHWKTTRNYALFHRLTSDAMLFSVVEPRHPCAGGLTIDDIQRRLAQQVSELHLDERVREGREALNKTLVTGQKKVSNAFNSFWADIEALREAQRKRNEERAMERASSDEKSLSGESLQSIRNNTTSPSTTTTTTSGSSTETNSFSWFGHVRRSPSVDVSQGQAPANTAGQRAGAYISSWGAWASERRKEWQDRRNSTAPATATATAISTSSSVTGPTSSEAALPSVSKKEVGGDSNNNDNNNTNNNRGEQSSSSSRRASEESTTAIPATTTLSRSISRRTKRWSNVLLKKEHRHTNSESDYESSSSRKCSLDITVPSSSSLSIADAPKSPLGQVQHQHQQSIEGGNATTTNNVPPKAEEEGGNVTVMKSSDDDGEIGLASR
ncbi:hypothetical protein UA08_00800 [Talaromyces atroroseus]|uniref:UDENN domain-containing protein n=1 Tax=Talaromyces atroroseus TaxID=1441469 RepID=A0A225AQS6_TALAT|nr:hypothetical protein UA08_00800 [Talaromyces atroroseus]OKL63971.1 hypothetical protein UA08_00800 [Talaromyces atroroseus]